MRENEQLQEYFDTLTATHDLLAKGTDQVRDRGLTIGRRCAEDAAATQRDTLELAKRLASNPAELSKGYGALIDSSQDLQRRALNFARFLAEESLGANGDARETLEQLDRVNRRAAQVSSEFARSCAAANPFAEAMAHWMEAANGAAGAGSVPEGGDGQPVRVPN